MTPVLISIRPWVWLFSGERFSVQLMNNARNPEKSCGSVMRSTPCPYPVLLVAQGWIRLAADAGLASPGAVSHRTLGVKIDHPVELPTPCPALIHASCADCP